MQNKECYHGNERDSGEGVGPQTVDPAEEASV